MWYLISQNNPDLKHVILMGKVYVVGRMNCEILVSGDQTVSRRHAELTVTHTEANLTNPSRLPVLKCKDLSKYGSWVNNERLDGERILQDGDTVYFGSPKTPFLVVYEPFVVTSSCLDTAAKKSVKKQLCILGGHMINEWKSDCFLLIMSKISVTIKVICALESQKAIVTTDYLETYIKHLQGTTEKPDPERFLPGLAETQLDPSEVSFNPNDKRKSVFQGLSFVFFGQKQFKKMSLAIELGGGMPVMWEMGGDVKVVLEPRTLVMNCTDTDIPQDVSNVHTKVQTLLEKKGKHVIQDAELGYAVLYCSTEKHCNPDYMPDEDLSRLPSQTLSQGAMFAPDTETQLRTQIGTQSKSKSRLASQTTVNETILSKSQTRTQTQQPGTPASPRPSTRQRQVSPTPGAREKSPSPGPTTKHAKQKAPATPAAKIKEEPISQNTPRTTRKRGRIEEEEVETNNSKKIKAEPVTPKSKPPINTKPLTNTATNKGATNQTETVWESDDDIDYSKIETDLSPEPQPSTLSRSSRRSPRKQSPAPKSPVPSKQRRRASPTPPPSPKPSSPKHSSRAEQTKSKTEKTRSRSRSRSPFEGQTKSKNIKTEAKVDLTTETLGESEAIQSTSNHRNNNRDCGKGQSSRSESEVIYRRKDRRQIKEESDEDDDQRPVTNGHDLPDGFLTTRQPIRDQVARHPDHEPDTDLPSNLVNVEVVSLVSHRPVQQPENGAGDCPEGFTRWKGKIVKNFKKFKKTQHAGSQGLPNIIGGSDLEVHQAQRTKEVDEWLRDAVQAESQHTAEDRRAQQLFDYNANNKRRGR